MANNSNPPTRPRLQHPLPARPMPIQNPPDTNRRQPFYNAPPHQPMGRNQPEYLSPSSGPRRQQHQSRFFRTTAPYTMYTTKQVSSGTAPTGDRSTGAHLGNAWTGPRDNARLEWIQGPPSVNRLVLATDTHTQAQAEARRAEPSSSMRAPKSAPTSPTAISTGLSDPKGKQRPVEEELEEGEIREGEVEVGKDEDEDFDTISLGSE